MLTDLRIFNFAPVMSAFYFEIRDMPQTLYLTMKFVIQIPSYNKTETSPQALRDLPEKLEGVNEIEGLVWGRHDPGYPISPLLCNRPGWRENPLPDLYGGPDRGGIVVLHSRADH